MTFLCYISRKKIAFSYKAQEDSRTWNSRSTQALKYTSGIRLSKLQIDGYSVRSWAGYSAPYQQWQEISTCKVYFNRPMSEVNTRMKQSLPTDSKVWPVQVEKSMFKLSVGVHPSKQFAWSFAVLNDFVDLAHNTSEKSRHDGPPLLC